MFKKKEKVNDPQKLTNGNLFAYGTLLLMMNTTNAASIYFYRIALGSTDIIALSGLVSLCSLLHYAEGVSAAWRVQHQDARGAEGAQSAAVCLIADLACFPA